MSFKVTQINGIIFLFNTEKVNCVLRMRVTTGCLADSLLPFTAQVFKAVYRFGINVLPLIQLLANDALSF